MTAFRSFIVADHIRGFKVRVTSNVNAVGLTAIHHRGSGTCTLQAELELAQRDGRDHAAEVYRQRSQIDDSNDVIESLKRENKNLAGIVVIVIIIVTDRRTDRHRAIASTRASIASRG